LVHRANSLPAYRRPEFGTAVPAQFNPSDARAVSVRKVATNDVE
jgi:hypothetical protein